jgi:hypothetical protein
MFTIWLYTPVEQPSPYPAKQHKMFTNDEKPKCLSKQTDQIQELSKNVTKIYED